MIDSLGAALVIRMGQKNLVSNNILIGGNSEPFVISGSENLIAGNYFSVDGALTLIHDDVRFAPPSPNLNFAYLAGDDAILEDNIFRGAKVVENSIDLYGNVALREAKNVVLRRWVNICSEAAGGRSSRTPRERARAEMRAGT